jgi:hypothetical protein
MGSQTAQASTGLEQGLPRISSVTEMRAVSRAIERCVDSFPAKDRA